MAIAITEAAQMTGHQRLRSGRVDSNQHCQRDHSFRTAVRPSGNNDSTHTTRALSKEIKTAFRGF
jgi:hypothetical protein